MRIIYIFLYQSICQYGIIVWGGGGANDNTLRSQNTQLNKAIRICLSKNNKIGSSNRNYIKFDLLPVVNQLYKKFTIPFILKKLPSKNNNILNKREKLAYDLKMNYPKKSIG
jgi:hypothetical protein